MVLQILWFLFQNHFLLNLFSGYWYQIRHFGGLHLILLVNTFLVLQFYLPLQVLWFNLEIGCIIDCFGFFITAITLLFFFWNYLGRFWIYLDFLNKHGTCQFFKFLYRRFHIIFLFKDFAQTCFQVDFWRLLAIWHKIHLSFGLFSALHKLENLDAFIETVMQKAILVSMDQIYETAWHSQQMDKGFGAVRNFERKGYGIVVQLWSVNNEREFVYNRSCVEFNWNGKLTLNLFNMLVIFRHLLVFFTLGSLPIFLRGCLKPLFAFFKVFLDLFPHCVTWFGRTIDVDRYAFENVHCLFYHTISFIL